MSDILVDQVFVAVGGVAVDQLAQETGQEKLHAEDDQKHRKVEERLLGDGPQRQAVRLLVELGGSRPAGT